MVDSRTDLSAGVHNLSSCGADYGHLFSALCFSREKEIRFRLFVHCELLHTCIRCGTFGCASSMMPANNGTQQPSQTSERLQRLKNCALAYYGIDPLSVSGLASNGGKWGLIAASAGGIPKAIPEGLGLVRTIRPPGSSSFTSVFSILSAATGGGGALRTVANFGSKWAGPIAIASAVIDATAIGICTASD